MLTDKYKRHSWAIFTAIIISVMLVPSISHQSTGALNFPPFFAHLKNFKTPKQNEREIHTMICFQPHFFAIHHWIDIWRSRTYESLLRMKWRKGSNDASKDFVSVAAESDSGERTRPQVPNDHEEPCQEIRHPGAQDDEKGDGVDNFVDPGALSYLHTFTLSLAHLHTFTTLTTLLIQEQRKAENEGVTEDDVNEIKNDISAFRWPTMTMPMMLTMTMTVMMMMLTMTMTMTVMMLSTAMTMKMTMTMLAILLTMLIKTGWHGGKIMWLAENWLVHGCTFRWGLSIKSTMTTTLIKQRYNDWFRERLTPLCWPLLLFLSIMCLWW